MFIELPALLLSAILPFQGPPPSPVRVDAAKIERVQDRRPVTGEVRAVQRAVVAVREAGLVLELLAREGERVEAGATLARLDPTRLAVEEAILEAQVIENDALLEERHVNLVSAVRERDVLLELFERDAINPKELADAETVVKREEARSRQTVAAGRVLAARSALLARRHADLEPRAPFAGIIVTRHTEVGEWVDVGGAIVEILTDKALEARVDVPQDYLAALRAFPGALQVRLDADGAELELEGWRIIPIIKRSGRSFQIIATLPPGTAGAAGGSLTASVPNGEEAELLTLARGSVLRGDTGPYVFVARPGAEGEPATADLVPVQVLFPVGSRIAVRSRRLAPGDLIVVEGNERLYPTAPLLPQPIAETGDAR